MPAAVETSDIQIQPYRGRDEADLIRLWNEILNRDPIDLATFRLKVTLDENFQPENLLLARSGSRLVGFLLSVYRRTPMYWEGLEEDNAWITAFGVLQGDRRRGISNQLFEAAEGRLHRLGRRTIYISPYTPNYFTPGVDTHAYPEADQWLQRRGYEVINQPVSMQCDLLNFGWSDAARKIQTELEDAEDICVRAIGGQDLPELLAMIADNFGAEWFRHAREYLIDRLVNGSPEIGFFVAVRDGQIIGYCQYKKERFGPFGVIPEMRNRGLGLVLLNHCLDAMRANGYRCAWFLWADAQAARFYRRAGFQTVREFSVFKKDLFAPGYNHR